MGNSTSLSPQMQEEQLQIFTSPTSFQIKSCSFNNKSLAAIFISSLPPFPAITKIISSTCLLIPLSQYPTHQAFKEEAAWQNCQRIRHIIEAGKFQLFSNGLCLLSVHFFKELTRFCCNMLFSPSCVSPQLSSFTRDRPLPSLSVRMCL